MFYNKTGMALFMGAYFCVLLYSGVSLAGLDCWGTRGLWVFVLWFALGMSLPMGLLQKRYSSQLRRLGGVMLAFVLHLSVAFLALDIWSLSAYCDLLPPPSPRAVAWIVNAALLWIAYGVARAQRIVVRSFEIELPSLAERPPLRLVAAADIHAGGVVERRYLQRLRKRIARCRPDIVLLPGDITDGDIACAVNAGLGETLASIEAPLGKYAVLGNHDIYAGAEASCRLLSDAGFIVLQDQACVIDEAFVLAGRNDPRGMHFGIARAPLASISGGRPDLPLVVADHTPQNPQEAAACGAVLQLSGHTHGGQVFPLNLLMKKMYGISAGLMKIGNTAVCISSGAGLWTMPLRTVTNSEIVLCTFVFVSK